MSHPPRSASSRASHWLADRLSRPHPQSDDLLRFAVLVGLALLSASGSSDGARIAAVALASVMGTELVFSLARRRPLGWGGPFNALVFALLVPADVSTGYVVMGAVFGTALGEQIFGGRGYGFLSPAVVGLAFLHFSLPALPAAPATEVPVIAAAAGAAVFLICGWSGWRLAAAALASLTLGTGHLPDAAALIVVVVIAADPATLPLARPARWISGGLLGLLALALTSEGAAPDARALVFAALLTAILSPLIDAAVIAVFTRRRRQRSSR